MILSQIQNVLHIAETPNKDIKRNKIAPYFQFYNNLIKRKVRICPTYKIGKLEVSIIFLTQL